MSITWVVQDNLGSTSSTANSIKRACENEGQNYVPIQVVPFSNSLPEMPKVDGKFVLYGRTTLMLNTYADDFWKQGMFFNPDTFTPEAYIRHWGDMMLNSDATVVEMRDVNTLGYELDNKIFVRPNDDLKLFTSGVITFEHLLGMRDKCVEDASEPVNLSTRLVIASSKDIFREWRLFIVDGKVVTGSQYLPDTSAFIPPGIVEFAETAASLWTPAPIFVMDIASDNKSLKIIECNCFNGSGFYESDLDLLVRTVSKYIELCL